MSELLTLDHFNIDPEAVLIDIIHNSNCKVRNKETKDFKEQRAQYTKGQMNPSKSHTASSSIADAVSN